MKTRMSRTTCQGLPLNNFAHKFLVSQMRCYFTGCIACVAGAKLKGEEEGEGEKHERGEREGSACYKSRCFCNAPTIF